MRIAWVGGVESNEKQLENVASKAGHEVEFHGGHMGGRGEDRLRAAIARADVVLIVTDDQRPDSNRSLGIVGLRSAGLCHRLAGCRSATGKSHGSGLLPDHPL